MADLSIVAANVKEVTGDTVINNLVAAAAITQGQSVYQTSATPAQWALAQGTTAVLSGNGSTVGIALNSALTGQRVSVWTGGRITIGATVVVGQVYCISAAVAGNICPISDIVATNFSTMLGYADTTTTLTSMSSTGALITGVAHG